MKLVLVVIFIISSSFGLVAQTITVQDNATKEPISGVAFYNIDKTKSTTSNINGEVLLNNFEPNEIIYIQHVSYQLRFIKKSKIDSKIYLNANTQDLDEVIISASKFKQQKRDIPQKIISINAKGIAFNNPQTSADLLEQTGQVFVQKSQLGGGSPIIRGFSTNRLLISVDGVRMNNAIFRGGNLQNVISIDPFTINNTEITLGAGSVIYGSDAIGGVMSFYTKTPKLSYTDSLKLNTQLVGRYATANNENTIHANVNLGYKHWGFLTSLSFTKFDDLRMGKHGPNDYLRPEFVVTQNNQDTIVTNSNPLLQKFTGYNQYNLMQKIRYEPKDNIYFDLGIFYTTTSNFPRYDRLIRYNTNGEPKSALWDYGPQKWFMAHLNATKLSSSSNLYNKLKLSVAYQNFKESRIDRNYQSETQNTTKENVDALSFNLDLEKPLTKLSKLFYGVEYVYNKIGSKGFETNVNTGVNMTTVSRYPNGASWQSLAAYLNYKYNPQNAFVFQTGLRYNHIFYNATFDENNVFLDLPFSTAKENTGALTGTAGITWIPTKTIQWKLNASTAFRSPNIDDIGKVFDSEPGSVVVPNNNLKPEYAISGELGLTLNFENTVIIDCATYYTYLDNALVRRDFNLNGQTEILYNGELSNIQAIQNASKSWIYGFEAGLKINFTQAFALTSQYSVIGGVEDNNGADVPVRHVAPSFGNTHLIYTTQKLKLDVYANYNNALTFDQLALSEKNKPFLYALDSSGNPYAPSWYTLNFRIQYQLTNNLKTTLALENITDQRYRTYSSGVAAAGRNLIAALHYSF